MENKIRNYVYQNDTNYTSYDSMKYLFVCIFLFLSLIIGTFATVAKLWWGLCILIFLDISFLLFMIVIPRIKKPINFDSFPKESWIRFSRFSSYHQPLFFYFQQAVDLQD